MKATKRNALLTLLAASVLGAIVYQLPSRRATSSIRISESVFDLGAVSVGDVHWRTVELENISDRTITVQGIRTPCPGAFERTEPMIIPQGMSLRFRVGLKIREGAAQEEVHTYRYGIRTNDPATPSIDLRLVAHMKSNGT